jgi:hypothetical protein
VVQVADSQLAFRGVLHFIEGISALFDSDCIAVSNQMLKFALLGFQDLLEFAQLGLCHFSPSASTSFAI